MRRGYKNKWVHDNSPQGDGLVTVTSPTGSIVRYQSVEELRLRNTKPSAIAKLREFGWIK